MCSSDLDAAKAVAIIEPGKLLPLRLPRMCRWTLLVLAACVGLGFVPEHRSQAYLDQQRDSAIIDDVGRNLEALTKLQVAMTPPHFERTEESLESVQELGQEFTRGKLMRDEALAKLSRLAAPLRRHSTQLGPAPTPRQLPPPAHPNVRPARNENLACSDSCACNFDLGILQAFQHRV